MAKKTLIITDDDSADRMLMKMAFEEKGIDLAITEFQNGAQLINYLQNECKVNPSCLILLDLNMPKKSGIDVLNFIKTHPAVCHIPIIVFTTSTSEHDRIQCEQLGAVDFISKPVDYNGYLSVASLINSFLQSC